MLRSFLILIALLTQPGAPSSPPGSVQQPSRSQESLVLRAGTEIPLRTLDALSSKTAFQGQRFQLEVATDIRIGDLIVIPAGTRAVGEIKRVVGKGMVGKSGKIDVQLLFVQLGPDRIRIDGSAHQKGKPGTAAVAASVLFIGGSAGFFSGTSASIPAGANLLGVTHDDLPFEVRGPSVPTEQP